VYTLSNTIRARRKEMGLTLEGLAGRVGVTPGALSHIEGGRRLPDPRNLLAIADALRLDGDELLTLLDEAHAERRAAQVGRSRPAERSSAATPRSYGIAHSAAFREMPIDALFSAEPGDTEGDTALAPDMFLNASIRTDDAAVPRMRAAAATSSRDRARWSPGPSDRLRAAEELAEEALRAIRTLRGMLDDEDPMLTREARRLLRELDVRGADE